MMSIANAASILLADLDKESRHSLRSALQHAGHTVTSVRTQRALLERLGEAQPHVVVLDVDIADGYALCARLKALSRVPVILIVPNAEDAIQRARSAGADDCLVRPVQPSILLWRVQQLLSSNAPAQQSFGGRLFDSVNDAILVVELNTGRILDANRQSSKLFGYSRMELLSMRYDEFDSGIGEDTSQMVARELTTKGHFIFEKMFRTRTSRLIPVEVSSRIIDYDGRKAVLSFVRDIRQRKQAEDDAAEQRRLMEALTGVAAALSASLNVSEVVDRLLEHLNRVLSSEAANIMLVENQRARIMGRRGYQWFEESSAWTSPGWALNELGAAQWMMKHRQPLLIPDTHDSPYWQVSKDTAWIRSFLGAPIVADQHVIGFINLDAAAVEAFTSEQASYLKAFADQASIALRNAMLYEAVQRHAAELERRVGQRTQELLEVNLRLKDQVDQRQRVESELREERNMMRTLIDNLPDHIYVKDRKGRFLLANTAGAAGFELGLVSALLGKTDFDFMPGELAQEYFDEEQELMRSGKTVTRELRRKDGEEWLLMTKVPLHDSQGAIIGLVGINRNITEIKRAEERLLHVIRGANCLFGFTKAWRQPNGDIHWNYFVSDLDAARTFLPLDVQSGENYEDAFWRSIPAEDRARITSVFKEALLGGKQFFQMEFTCRRADGELRWLNIDVQVRQPAPSEWTLISVCTDITERKAAESAMQRANELLEQRVAMRTVELSKVNQALRESEERYRALVEHAPEAIVVFDADTESFVDANPNATLLFGLMRDELLERSLHHFSPEQQPDGRNSVAAMRAYIGKAITGQTPVFEWVYRSADGREVPCEIRLLLLPNTGGTLLRGSITDITERKLAEQAEREQRLLAGALSDAAAALSTSLELSEVLDRILDYAARVMPPHEVSTVLLIEDEVYVRTVRQRQYTDAAHTDFETLSSNTRFLLDSLPELRTILENDQPIAVANAGDPDGFQNWGVKPVRSYIGAPIHAEGRVVGFVHLASSTTGQFTLDHAHWLQAFTNQAGIAIQNARLYEAILKNALDLRMRVAERTAELDHERGQLRAIMDSMMEGVIYYAIDGQTQYINQSLYHLTGYSDHELAHMGMVDLAVDIVPEERQRFRSNVIETIQRLGAWRGELRLQRKNGEVFDASLISTGVRAVDGQFSGYVTVIRDISQEKRLQAQKSRFIATASHELRTPVTNVKTRLYLLSKQPEKLDIHLPILESVVERMRKLVEDLLDVSRFEHGIIDLNRETMVLQDLIEHELEIQQAEADQKQIELQRRWSQHPLYVSVDVGRMKQVITNLLTNALNYTPSGGVIAVEVEPDGDEFVLVRVRDNGVGIAPDLLPNIFQPFVRGSDYTGGTGLGLSITREIIELHGGSITVESEQRVGTCFTIRLARHHPASSPFIE
ncbi:MAG: PAS domain S-box protein [bacterium]|nr:PAS domain S-box protein [bacterium]